jgi:hypothetical protein
VPRTKTIEDKRGRKQEERGERRGVDLQPIFLRLQQFQQIVAIQRSTLNDLSVYKMFMSLGSWMKHLFDAG